MIFLKLIPIEPYYILLRMFLNSSFILSRWWDILIIYYFHQPKLIIKNINKSAKELPYLSFLSCLLLDIKKYNYYELRLIRKRILRPLARPLHQLWRVPWFSYNKRRSDVSWWYWTRKAIEGRGMHLNYVGLSLKDRNFNKGTVPYKEEGHLISKT